MRWRVCLLCLALWAHGCVADTDDVLTSTWGRYLDKEGVAMAYTRTRQELVAFAGRCKAVEPYWARVHEAHAQRRRVVVFDVRHNWCASHCTDATRASRVVCLSLTARAAYCPLAGTAWATRTSA